MRAYIRDRLGFLLRFSDDLDGKKSEIIRESGIRCCS